MNLYELTTAYQQILDLSEESGDDFTTALSQLSDSIDVKIENIAKVIRTLESKVTAFKNEEKRLADRRRAVENNIKRLKDYAQESMYAVGTKKVEGELFTVAIQKSPVSLKIEDETYIPKGYYIEQEPKLDRKELLADLKQGEEIIGVELVQNEHLRIR